MVDALADGSFELFGLDVLGLFLVDFVQGLQEVFGDAQGVLGRELLNFGQVGQQDGFALDLHAGVGGGLSGARGETGLSEFCVSEAI